MPAAPRRLPAPARRLRLALALGGLAFGGLMLAPDSALAAQAGSDGLSGGSASASVRAAAAPMASAAAMSALIASISVAPGPVAPPLIALPPSPPLAPPPVALRAVSFQPVAPAPAPAPSSFSSPLAPLTARGRVDWFVTSTVGPRSLGVGVLSAGWGTLHDSPDEYGPSWAGFGKRYVVRLSGMSIGNAIEASLGAVWGEDPRYRRAEAGRRPGSRIAHAAKMTVMADRADGRLAPAYARGIAIVGNNFITNAWRVDSQGSINDALSRSMVGVTGRFAGNLFEEFWPDIRRLVRR